MGSHPCGTVCLCRSTCWMTSGRAVQVSRRRRCNRPRSRRSRAVLAHTGTRLPMVTRCWRVVEPRHPAPESCPRFLYPQCLFTCNSTCVCMCATAAVVFVCVRVWSRGKHAFVFVFCFVGMALPTGGRDVFTSGGSGAAKPRRSMSESGAEGSQAYRSANAAVALLAAVATSQQQQQQQQHRARSRRRHRAKGGSGGSADGAADSSEQSGVSV